MSDFTEDRQVEVVDYTENGGEVIFSTGSVGTERIELHYYNTELWLGYSDGEGYGSSENLTEEDVDKLIEIMEAWKTWRNDV